MPNFKGTVYESLRMFTQQQFGLEAVDRVLAELPSADRELLSGVNALGWYPVEPILRFHHALDRIYGEGDLALCERAGRFSAGWAMNTVLKIFLRFQTPGWLVQKATSVWGRYHDTGRWVVAMPSPKRIQGDLYDFEVRDPAFCARLRGWLHGASALTGGANCVVSETLCTSRGADHCQFTLHLR
jgi:hypothetical protein